MKNGFSYVLAPQGVRPGDSITSGPTSAIRPGNTLPLSAMPIGQQVRSLAFGLLLLPDQASSTMLYSHYPQLWMECAGKLSEKHSTLGDWGVPPTLSAVPSQSPSVLWARSCVWQCMLVVSNRVNGGMNWRSMVEHAMLSSGGAWLCDSLSGVHHADPQCGAAAWERRPDGQVSRHLCHTHR